MRNLAMLVLLAAATAPVAPVLAQPAPQAASPAKTDAYIGQRVEQRIAQMHRRLRITPEQEPAWNAFAQTMRDNATKSAQAYRQHASAVGTMSAVDNLRMFAQIEQERAQGLQALLSSFEALYGSLSDDQKKTADAIFRRQEERAEQHHQQHTK